MKLELVKKITIGHPILTAKTVDDCTAIFLSYNEESMYYQMIYISSEEFKIIELDYREKYYSVKQHPVLFSIDNQFGFIKNQKELFLYSFENKQFETIGIHDSDVLPQCFKLQWRVPISDCSLLPICFDNDGIGMDTRYIAFLQFNINNKWAKWESCTTLQTKNLKHHNENTYPPKLDTAMLKDNALYTFTSGAKVTSINKWGMDYYACCKGNINGRIEELLLDSGNLEGKDGKKRGVNGLFSSSQRYLMLTPVFQSDEWKGKQKIFSLESNVLEDITFPRGFGKYPQIIEHLEDCFWVYLRDSKEIAICKEV
ncbi:hypothetical protein [Myroides profundi]|uniref:Uncharacterized protein n=1 Tax=Myroides profundi TaxID=480520 RepID=A0AAJ4W6G6_MYRPR|nr:hypothetical protein [Myroides profundi]AJH15042.1 hypothetical protein MPR_1867 [Myroides profundi]SER46058.1 hypothetical protein SAMN04488089_11667 [Myroides profundi]